MARRRLTASQYRDAFDRLWDKYGIDLYGDSDGPPAAVDYREYSVNGVRGPSVADFSGLAASAEAIRAELSEARDRGRTGGRFRLPPTANERDRPSLHREYRYGKAEARVNRAPAALRERLTVQRDASGAPVLRLRDAGRGWRAAPDTPARVLLERVQEHLREQRAMERENQKQKHTAPARERARARADAYSAELKPINASLSAMRRSRR